jgi:hypothetical protein
MGIRLDIALFRCKHSDMDVEENIAPLESRMCWNAHTSFATLGFGTLLNLLSYFILVKRDSPVAVFVWGWQYALLMQVPEGVAWMQLNNADSDNISAVSRVAMLLNVTQPLVLFLITRASGLKGVIKYGHVALFMYLLLIASEADQVWTLSSSIAPEEGCPHLTLGYWNLSRGLTYVFASLFVISEIRLVYWAFVNVSIFLTSLILSLSIYTCGIGSVWCWFISMTGPILVSADMLQTNCIRVFSMMGGHVNRHEWTREEAV